MKRRQQIISLGLCLGLLTTAAVGTFSGCASSSTSRSTGQYMDDKTLQHQVSSALGENTGNKFDNVNVEANRGTVQLGGYVETAEQKMKASDIVKSVPGVADVQNNILVRPATPGTRP